MKENRLACSDGAEGAKGAKATGLGREGLGLGDMIPPLILH